MADEDITRRPAGSGVDGGYVGNRKPTIDDQDDVDDEDGILMEELDEDTDLTLRVEEPDEELDEEDDTGR